MSLRHAFKLVVGDKVEIITETGCWIWMGGTQAKGRYGEFYFRGSRYGAHRLSYEAHVGDVPNGMEVCHRCDVGLCVNPSHLFVGTHHENMMDMKIKRRFHREVGDLLPKAKVKEADVMVIRASTRTLREIASQHGLSVSQVWNIRARKQWAHVP